MKKSNSFVYTFAGCCIVFLFIFYGYTNFFSERQKKATDYLTTTSTEIVSENSLPLPNLAKKPNPTDSQLSSNNLGVYSVEPISVGKNPDKDNIDFITNPTNTVINIGPDIDVDDLFNLTADTRTISEVQNIGPDLDADAIEADIGIISQVQYVGEDIDVDDIVDDEKDFHIRNVGENIDVDNL